MSIPYDSNRMYKLPPNLRFFDISEIWFFFNRPIVLFLYSKPISPNQITCVSLICCLISFLFFISENKYALIFGAFFLYLKLLFDNVDGNLARVRNETSRLGRFFDSLVDFIATLLAYGGLTWRNFQVTENSFFLVLGIFAALSCLLQSSFFVYYFVSYTEFIGVYRNNRIDETVSDQDRDALRKEHISRLVYYLQLAHQLIYGWQDKLAKKIDAISFRKSGISNSQTLEWYGDKQFLTLSSPLSLCNNQFILVIFALMNQVTLGFILIAIFGNIYLVGLIIYKARKKLLN